MPHNIVHYQYQNHFEHIVVPQNQLVQAGQQNISISKSTSTQNKRDNDNIKVKKQNYPPIQEKKVQDHSSQCEKYKEFKQCQVKKSRKKRNSKDEYIPYHPERNKGKKLTQNTFRNVLPNVVHQIFSFIQKKNRSQKIIEKMIQELPECQKVSIKRFYLYQNLIKPKINNYINQWSLCELKLFQQPTTQIYSVQEQKIFLKISRALAKHFLSKEFDTIILTSNRMKRDSRLYHLEIKRNLKDRLYEIFNSQN